MIGPALRAWQHHNCGVARFDVVNGNLVLDALDAPTGIVRLNPEWLQVHGFGHHVEDDGATIRAGRDVFRKVRQLDGPFAAYEHATS